MLRIFLVDDERLTRRLLREIVENHPALQRRVRIVGEADDGISALNFLSKHGSDVDLLITDLIHPRPDGLELAQSLRQLSPHIKILILTAGTLLPHQAQERGADALLQKPFMISDLLKMIRLLFPQLEPLETSAKTP